MSRFGTASRSNRRPRLKDSNYPGEQPKNGVDDALVDRNSDPDALAAPAPSANKTEGDALRDGSGSRHGEPPSHSRFEGKP
jgi:hypothetical protein